MSITVKLYGVLKKNINENINNDGLPLTLRLEEEKVKSVSDLIKELKIEDKEISHIFVNGAYSGKGTKLKNGDRVGLFPKKMAVMFVEIPVSNSFYVTVKLFANLRKYGPKKSIIKIPKGTTLKSVIEKVKIPKEEEKLIILINGIPQWNRNYTIEPDDIIAIFPPLAGG